MRDEEVAELRAKLSKIESNVGVIGEIVIFAVAIAFGLGVGELVENWDKLKGHGLMASLATGASILIASVVLRLKWKD